MQHFHGCFRDASASHPSPAHCFLQVEDCRSVRCSRPFLSRASLSLQPPPAGVLLALQGALSDRLCGSRGCSLPWSSGACRHSGPQQSLGGRWPGRPLSLFPCPPLTLQAFRPAHAFSVLLPTQAELRGLPEMREESPAGDTFSKIILSPQFLLETPTSCSGCA